MGNFSCRSVLGKRFTALVLVAAFAVCLVFATDVANFTDFKKIFTTSGTYVLTADINVTASITMASSKDITSTLDLNGHNITMGSYTITMGAEKSFIVAYDYYAASLTISGTGTISGAGNGYGQLFVVNPGSTLSLQSAVVLTGTKSQSSSGDSNAVIYSQGSVVLNGSTINANGSNMNAITISSDKGWLTSYSSDPGEGEVGGTSVINGNITTADKGGIDITGGTVNGDVNAKGSGDVAISGGNISGDVNSSGTGGVEISGGTIGGDVSSSGSGAVEINGGSFTKPETIEQYLQDNQCLVENEDGTFVVSDVVATVDGNKYARVQDAVNAAETGDTVILAGSADLGTDALSVSGKSVTLDLKGAQLTGSPTAISVASGAAFTVVDTTGGGVVQGGFSVPTGATLNIVSGSYTNNPSAYIDAEHFAKFDSEHNRYVVTKPENTVSLSMEGDVGINFYLDADSYTDDSDAYVKITFNDYITIKGNSRAATTTVAVSSLPVSENRYVLSIDNGPVQLINEATVEIFDGDDNLLYRKDNYTVRDFCESVIGSSTNTDLVNLCTALLNYGSATQTYFNAQTDNLPNKDLNIAGLIDALDTSGWSDYYGDFEGELPEYVGTSLVCSTDMVVRHYFKAPVSSYNPTLSSKPDGSSMSLSTGSNSTGYYIEVSGIESTYLDSTYTITLTGEQGACSIKYSPMCYVRKTVARNAQASLVSLCKAIYLYSESAKAYFN